MAQPSSVAREPSMEEILASIRRIIEDSEPVARSPESEIDTPANDVSSIESEAEAFRAELAVPRQEPQAARAPAERPQAERPQPDRPRSMADIHAAIRKEAPAAAQVHPLRPSEQPRPAAAAPAPRVEVKPEPARPAAEAPRPAQPAAAQPAAAQPLSEPRAEPRQKPVDAQIAAEVESVAAILRPAVDAPHAAVAKPDTINRQAMQHSPRPEVQRGMLISDRSGKQVTASFGELAEAYQTIRKRSLADAAEEMMKPMLQDWLDNNLPRIVERLVREEIERVARGEAD